MESTINKHQLQLLAERYRFNMGLLMGELDLGQGVTWKCIILIVPFILGIHGKGDGSVSRDRVLVF